MKNDRLWRHLLAGFLIALALYVTLFWFIEHRRTAQTPWIVWLEMDGTGHIKLEISQQSLGLGPVEVRLAAATNGTAIARTMIEFRSPKPVPRSLLAGTCLFEDLTFLPGTVALNIAGADIQMLPRALTIGTNEFTWGQVRVVEVQPDGSSRVVK